MFDFTLHISVDKVDTIRRNSQLQSWLKFLIEEGAKLYCATDDAYLNTMTVA